MGNDLVIPIVAIVGGLALVGFFWWLMVSAGIRERELLHAERQAAIAKGLPPPDEPRQSHPVADGGKAASPPATNALGTGLFWLFLGLGVIVAMRIVDPGGTRWGWGVIPVSLGLAYLVGFGLSRWLARGKPDGETDPR